MDLGSAGRGPKTKKPSVPKAWRDLRKSSKKALKLFSSFLRGASCPKSPRFKREGVNSSPPQLHLLSFRSPSMSSKTSNKRQKGSVWRFGATRPFVSRRQQNVLPLRPIRISMHRPNFRSTISRRSARQPTENSRHPAFRTVSVLPQLFASATCRECWCYTLRAAALFSGTTGVNTLWGSKF
jgi:hypothetical protein